MREGFILKKFIISFLLTLVVISFLFTVFGGSDLDRNEPIGPTEDGTETSEEDENPIPKGKTYPDELFFAVLGVDGNGLGKEKGLRSDVILVARVNFKSGETKILQINRDSRVPVKGQEMKINAAHAYGGPSLAIQTLRDYLGIDLEYYVKVDFQGIMDIVDLVGGVEFDVPVNMKYDDPTAKPPLHINLKKGKQHLDGKKSHDLLRFRHNNGQGHYPGGFSREEVQLMWIKEFARTVLKPKNILKMPELIKKGLNSVDTNIPITTILSSATGLGNIDVEKIEMHSIKGEGYKIRDGGWYWFNDEEDKKDAVNRFFYEYKL